MAEWTNGLHRLVTIPAVYSWVQKTLGGPDAKGRIASRLFSGLAGKHVVEIGCGPGLWSDYLSHAASFTGIDRSPKHIEVATSSYGSDRVRFLCGDLAHADVISTVDNCDAVIAIGILHHLDDDIARDVLAQAAAVLRPHGVFIGLEPVYHGILSRAFQR